MRNELRKILILGLTIAAVAVCAGRNAMALGFDDIAGKWCGSVSSYTFRPATLTVVLYSDNSRREYKVDSYEYTDSEVSINWWRDKERLFTKFSEFSADDRLMVQVQNTAGPRREFRRCS